MPTRMTTLQVEEHLRTIYTARQNYYYSEANRLKSYGNSVPDSDYLALVKSLQDDIKSLDGLYSLYPTEVNESRLS
jgi:hypothetical protein